MSMMNFSHERGLQKLLDYITHADLDTDTRIELISAIHDILRGKAGYERRIRELEEQLLRNPSFPGDMVGWLDDDFTLPDEDDPDDEDDS